jgi:hypothetical protein
LNGLAKLTSACLEALFLHFKKISKFEINVDLKISNPKDARKTIITHLTDRVFTQFIPGSSAYQESTAADTVSLSSGVPSKAGAAQTLASSKMSTLVDSMVTSPAAAAVAAAKSTIVNDPSVIRLVPWKLEAVEMSGACYFSDEGT